MRIAVAADELTGIAGVLVGELRRRGHDVVPHGALAAATDRLGVDAERSDRENVAHLAQIERSEPAA